MECHETSIILGICAKSSLDFGTWTHEYPLNDQNGKENQCKNYENDPKPLDNQQNDQECIIKTWKITE